MKNYITIQHPEKGEDYISDIIGNEILCQKVSSGSSMIDVSGLGKGLYFVRFRGERGVITQKFIKE